MSTGERSIVFRSRDLKGSRLHCLLLTSRPRTEVSAFLNALVAPHALISPEDHWAPNGFIQPEEAKLGQTAGFLNLAQQETITRWWLAVSGRANTPNWDLLSNCQIEGKKGLLLIEAKAHEGEFSDEGSGAKSAVNIGQIESALGQATEAWNALHPGFSLSAGNHYQLSNRFAFAWKLADMGIPVVLVYLAFLDADEMANGKRVLFTRHDQWRTCVLARSNGVVPEASWNRTFNVDGIPVTVLIRSATVAIDACVVAEEAGTLA